MGDRPDENVCIVTSARSGTGRACATDMAVRGGCVLVVDRNKVAGEETALIIHDGGTAELFVCDLAQRDQIVAMVHLAHFGRRECCTKRDCL